MDEAQLKKILGDAPLPKADDNARKTALNLAMAEFEAVQKESNKIIQIFSVGPSPGRQNPLLQKENPWRRK